MGYFPNGTAGMAYEEDYCVRCVHRWHDKEEGICAVMLAHLLHNYEECNNDDSILHILIPLNKEGWNEQCAMFIEDMSLPDPNQLDMFAESAP